MSQTKLVATTARTTGSSSARRLRAEGHIPGVLYGHGMEPISVTVERRELRLALSGPAGANTVLALAGRWQQLPGRRQGDAAPSRQAHGQPHRLPAGQHERGDHGVGAACVSRARPRPCREGGLVDAAVDCIDVADHPQQHAERVRHRRHRHAARRRHPPVRRADAQRASPPRRPRHAGRHGARPDGCRGSKQPRPQPKRATPKAAKPPAEGADGAADSSE